MKNTLLFVVIMFLYVSSFGQKKPSIAGFQDSDRYDLQDSMRANPSLKGIPILDTFRRNYGLEYLQLDKKSDQAFLAKLVKEFPSKYFATHRIESNKPQFVKVPLKTGATLVFSSDTLHDRRIFVVMSPYYYFTVTEHLLWFDSKKGSDGFTMGRTDGYRIETDPVSVIKELLYPKTIVTKK